MLCAGTKCDEKAEGSGLKKVHVGQRERCNANDEEQMSLSESETVGLFLYMPDNHEKEIVREGEKSVTVLPSLQSQALC